MTSTSCHRSQCLVHILPDVDTATPTPSSSHCARSTARRRALLSLSATPAQPFYRPIMYCLAPCRPTCSRRHAHTTREKWHYFVQLRTFPGVLSQQQKLQTVSTMQYSPRRASSPGTDRHHSTVRLAHSAHCHTSTRLPCPFSSC